MELIETFEDRWNWDDEAEYHSLSHNESLSWSEELIDKYQDKLDWKALSINPALPWSERLIDRYIDKWDWNNMSWNYGLPLTQELIDKYNKLWNWQHLFSNASFPWSIESFNKYKSQLDLEDKEIYWTMRDVPSEVAEALIYTFKDKIDWHLASAIDSIPKNFEFLSQYEEYWDYKELRRNEPLFMELLIKKLTPELIQKLT